MTELVSNSVLGTDWEVRSIVTALSRSRNFGHPVTDIEVIETHISYVILTGRFAYKIKKPVVFPFLDFSTLAARKHYLEEELRLNRRTAPELYLEVVAITESGCALVIEGTGRVVEHALKMVQFDQALRLDSLVEHGGLSSAHIRALARTVANFHDNIAVASEHSVVADFETFVSDMRENFDIVSQRLTDRDVPSLEWLQQRSDEMLSAQQGLYARRKMTGFVRECHGDLHLSNIVLLEDQPTPFDCIEFNAQFRWIDVINEIAFVIMDFDHRGHGNQGWLFLLTYLEETGDVDGLELLSLYLIYRAMIRAKVAVLRLSQDGLSAAEMRALTTRALGHIQQACGYARLPEKPSVYLTHGLSGSGKSWLSEQLACHMRAIRVRSDVERKRIASTDLYTQQTTEATYHWLMGLTRRIVASGYSVVVDATFLTLRRREEFHHLAEDLGVECKIIWTDAPVATLEQRLVARSNDAHEPSDATVDILHKQLKEVEALTREEQLRTIKVNTDRTVNFDVIAQLLT